MSSFAYIARYPLTVATETVYIGTTRELAVALDTLGKQYDRIVLEQLRPHLAQIISDPLDVTLLIKSLSLDDQLYLIEALGPGLANSFREARYLSHFMATSRDAQVETKVLVTLGREGLRALITTPEELADVAQWFYGRSAPQLLELLGNAYLKSLFKNGYQLSIVLDSLDHTAQDDLLKRLKWEQIVTLVRDSRDLAHLLRTLVDRDSARLLDHYTREQLITIIGSASDWKYLNDHLDTVILERMYRKLGASSQNRGNRRR
jgi:hypothetical protein